MNDLLNRLIIFQIHLFNKKIVSKFPKFNNNINI